MIAQKVPLQKRLGSHDWSFKDAAVEALHSIHPYPAKFIPQIPRTLIREIGVPRSSILLDPFCGSGTTLAEAQQAGIESTGIDSNPIACLISRVKTTPLPATFISIAERIAEQAERNPAKQLRQIPNVDHWFKRDVQIGLESLSREIRVVKEGPIRDALSLALSSIIVRVSNQDSDTRYAAIEKAVDRSHVLRNFLQASQKIKESLPSVKGLAPARVICSDSTRMQGTAASRKVGLVITSPPYPNAYEYWLYHKYRMYWLGYDPKAVKSTEIGARAHFFKKNHHTGETFRHQMQLVLQYLSNIADRSAHLCFVVGRSMIHGRVVDNAGIISEEAEKVGMVKRATLTREIQSTRKSFNLKHANIKSETVIVFSMS